MTGRHFASAEILTGVAAFLHLVDAERVPGADTLADDMTRIGLGVNHVKGKMMVRIKQRV